MWKSISESLTPLNVLFPGNQSQGGSTNDGNLHRRDSARRRTSAHLPPKTNHLVISGGDGYEDFRLTNSSETVGRDDSTNHLLLWRVWDSWLWSDQSDAKTFLKGKMSHKLVSSPPPNRTPHSMVFLSSAQFSVSLCIMWLSDPNRTSSPV